MASPIRPITGCAALAAVPGYKPPVLVVTEGELVTVRLTAPVPISPVEVALGSERVALPATNPTTFRVIFSPGIYEHVGLSARWLRGDVPYSFGLDVRSSSRPADPVPRGRLTLTG